MKIMQPFSVTTLILTVSLGLTACGSSGDDNGFSGGGGEPANPIEPGVQLGGIWNGNSTGKLPSSPATPSDITILTTDDGRIRFISDFAIQAAGFAQLVPDDNGNDETDLTADITAFAPTGFIFSDGLETSFCSINAGFIATTSMTGEYECADREDTGSFDVRYNADSYEQPSAIASLEGTWVGADFNAALTSPQLAITIDAAGIITGQNDLGCVVGGQVNIIDAAYNLYEMNITLQNCAELNGNYSGLATLRTDPIGVAQDEFLYQVDNGRVMITELVFR